MVFRTLRPGELEPWVEHCSVVFSEKNDMADYFRNHFLDDPQHDFDGVFIAEDNGQIASTVRVFVREIYVGGYRVGMGGIGEVSTKEAYRKQGLSGELLKMAIDYMVRKNLQTSMLFTGVHPHYARYGWFTMPKRLVSPNLKSISALPNGYSLRPIEEQDMSAVRGLYALSAGRFDGVLVREHPDYWDQWVRRQWKNPVVLEYDGRLLAYMDVNIREQDKVLWLNDYGTEPGCDWILPMLAAYAQGMPYEAKALIPAPLMPENNGPFTETKGAMLRLNAPFYLGDKCIDTAGKLARVCADHIFWDTDDF